MEDGQIWYAAMPKANIIKQKKSRNAYITQTDWKLRQYDSNCFDYQQKTKIIRENEMSFSYNGFQKHTKCFQ